MRATGSASRSALLSPPQLNKGPANQLAAMHMPQPDRQTSTETVEHFRIIRKAIENDRLVMFVGSGISCDSGLPSWGRLINAMRGCLAHESDVNYLRIAEKYYHQYGRNTYYSKISEFFPDSAEPNELHRLILQLKPRHIVTTNWDNLIEKEIRKQGLFYYTVATDDKLASSPSSQLLIKMHGDLNHRNIVFRESDYSGYADSRPLIENYVRSLFSTNIVLFAGYSLSDYNLDQILSWTRNRTKDAPPCYAVFPDQVVDFSELSYFANKGVFPISISASAAIATEQIRQLSVKGQQLAFALSAILEDNLQGLDQQIRELLTCTRDWSPLHPCIFVRLAKQQLGITTVNKIYYDSEHDAICYRISRSDKAISRHEYKAVRKLLKQILRHLPVREAWLLATSEKGIRYTNSDSRILRRHYGCYDFAAIIQRSKSFSMMQIAEPEKCYALAFSHYFQHNLSEASDLFGQAANLFFQQKRYSRSLLSSFSKRHATTSPTMVFDSSFERTLELRLREELPQHDSVNKEIYRFPPQVSTFLSSFIQCLSSNNAISLEQLLIAQRLNIELKSQVKTIKNGGIVISSKHNSVQSLLRWFIDFVLGNELAIVYTQEFRLVLKTHFQSLLLLVPVNRCPALDDYICYSAIVSYEANELSDFLFEILEGRLQLTIGDDAVDYILLLLKNSLSGLVAHSDEQGIRTTCRNVFNNAITLLAYCSVGASVSDRVIDLMNEAIRAPAWLELVDSANRYIALRAKMEPTSLSVDKLDRLLDEQIRRLSDIRSYMPLERSHMLPNLLSLLSKGDSVGAKLQHSEHSIDRLILAIKDLGDPEKLMAVSDILFPLFWFASGSVRLKIEAYLREMYVQLRLKGLGSEGIVFALNLFSLEILGREELDFILDQLSGVLNESRATGSYASSLLTIEKQLTGIPEDLRNEHRETLARLAEAASKMRLFWTSETS
jgi:hypothetical protein